MLCHDEDPLLQHNENMSDEIDLNPHYLKDVDSERAIRLSSLIPFLDCHAGRNYR